MAGKVQSMARYEARIEITHLPGILDPQGVTVERALPSLGYTNVSRVRVGKSIRLEVTAPDEATARSQVVEMCERLLANTVIEAG
jgi:phosphoribosylformylglycinamidine synthase subunit PurS